MAWLQESLTCSNVSLLSLYALNGGHGKMAGLAQLRLTMMTSILLVSIIFAVFLTIIMLVLDAPLILALVLTVIFVFFQYLIGPAMVKASTRLRYIEKGENPWLETTVQELAQKSGIPPPHIAIVPSQSPNAFVFGRTAGSATLALHEGLLTSLDKEEVRGVIGHELGHIKHRDYIVMTALSALPLIAYIIARMAFTSMRWSGGRSSGKDKGDWRIAAAAIGALSYVVYIVSLLCVMGLSRLREHYADAFSAYLTGSPRSLESALAKITYGLSLAPEPPSGARPFYIGDPAMAKQEFQAIVDKKSEYDLDRDGVLDERELELAMEKEAKSTWRTINTWFSTHPPTFKRLLLLKEIEKEMATGQYNEKSIYRRI